MMRTTLLAMALVPLALGDYSYSFTDAPTAAPTTLTASPTASMAPTRTETYAPTRMTEAPSYAPTTDTYAPTMAPTATGVPTFTDAPTGAPTNATNTTAPNRRRALLEKGSSFIDESVWFQRALAADKSGVVQSLRDIWGY